MEAGLAIAEMIASLSVPTVSLVLGGGHSIGVPMAVSADYSFVVPSATMVIHPVRTNGMFIGVAQSYREHGENPGPDHHLHFQSHSHVPGKTGRTNAGHYAAGKRCGNYVRRSGGSERRSNR